MMDEEYSSSSSNYVADMGYGFIMPEHLSASFLQAVQTLCSPSSSMPIGGYRVEYTIECHDWEAAVSVIQPLVLADPLMQLRGLISTFSGGGGDGVLDTLLDGDLSDYSDNEISEMLGFRALLKIVTPDMYRKVCSVAFQLAVNRNLFIAAGKPSDELTQEKQFLLVDLFNLIGLYGWDISKRYS